MGAYRYTTERCRRVWRWYSHVGPAERAPAAATNCVATPGPLPAAPLAWAKPLAAAVVAGGLIGGGAYVGSGLVRGSWDGVAGRIAGAAGGDRGAVGAGVGYEVPQDAYDRPAAGASPGTGPYSPSLLADVARDTAAGGSPATDLPPALVSKGPQDISEPPATAAFGVAVLAAVALRRRRRAD